MCWENVTIGCSAISLNARRATRPAHRRTGNEGDRIGCERQLSALGSPNGPMEKARSSSLQAGGVRAGWAKYPPRFRAPGAENARSPPLRKAAVSHVCIDCFGHAQPKNARAQWIRRPPPPSSPCAGRAAFPHRPGVRGRGSRRNGAPVCEHARADLQIWSAAIRWETAGCVVWSFDAAGPERAERRHPVERSQFL